MSHPVGSLAVMGFEKALSYMSIVIAALVITLFLADLVTGVFGSYYVMDALFIIGAALVLWSYNFV